MSPPTSPTHDERPHTDGPASSSPPEPGGRPRIEERQAESLKMEAIGRLAGGVAHDFNNILAAMLVDVDWVIDQLGPEQQEVLECIEGIKAAAQRAGTLTHQLLAFSRRQVLKPSVLALNTVVDDMHKMLARMIGEDITLVASLDPTLGSVQADPGQLQQVILNLAVNARDAMPGGGSLSIETRNTTLEQAEASRLGEIAPGPYVMVSMRDTGCGMEEEVAARIFEPFFTTKEIGTGTGLGLSTVFGIVRQSGGAISVETRPGAGSTFRVYLPRVDRPPSIAPPPPSAGRAMGRETVLLVEDDDHVRSSVRRILRARGYTVLEASSGDEAIARVRAAHASAGAGELHELDLVLSDLVMPGTDGWTTSVRIRELRPTAKFLFMSGYAKPAILRSGGDEVGARFLAKPFSAEELARAVRAAIDEGGGARE